MSKFENSKKRKNRKKEGKTKISLCELIQRLAFFSLHAYPRTQYHRIVEIIRIILYITNVRTYILRDAYVTNTARMLRITNLLHGQRAEGEEKIRKRNPLKERGSVIPEQ